MAGTVLIAAIGIFVLGVAVGNIVKVTRGIYREKRHYEEVRRFRQEHGHLGGQDRPEHFLPDEAPDGVSEAARRFNGLYVRHLRADRRYDSHLAVGA